MDIYRNRGYQRAKIWVILNLDLKLLMMSLRLVSDQAPARIDPIILLFWKK